MKQGRDFLRYAYFFQDLDDAVVDAVAELCGSATYRAGEFIFSEGNHGDTLFIVLSGEVQVWKHHGREDANLLSRYQTGRIFGEMALVDELPRSATAVAARDSELLFLRRADFSGLVRQYPELAMSIMRSLSAIVRESNDSFVADLHHRNTELEEAYRKLTEAQKELLENERLSNLGKMSNMVLHDIRNPVAVLKGYAEMLERVADDPERVREFARRVTVEAERLGHLSGELLDYARGEIRLDMSVIPPSKVISAAVGYVEERARIDGIGIEVDVRDDTAIVVDFHRIVRVLLNLLDNARKACGSGGTIRVVVDRDDRVVQITVEDTGEGMSAEIAERIFEPFYTRSRRGGTGLGLVIVQNIVEAHGGTLSVTSIPGEGARFTVRVPAALSRGPEIS
ncbi:MAG: ATP-binding protein [Spirochaeta sp.]|jgi:signal transduction histidine kinase|nr:ATP-binding protein [Spirochaeta sp.]